jgi:hypothetical protein
MGRSTGGKRSDILYVSNVANVDAALARSASASDIRDAIKAPQFCRKQCYLSRRAGQA